MQYHKIETLYERDEKTHKIKPEFVLRNPAYGWINTWEFTEKVDGTNIRIIWHHDEKRVEFQGKTDASQISAKLVGRLIEAVKPEQLEAIFPEADAVIYCEGYGAGIQKGGIYRSDQSVIVFDVLVGGQWWLSRANVVSVASGLGLFMVPDFGVMTLEAARALVQEGFQSRIPGAKGPAEGLVGRTPEALFDKKGDRLIVKLKTKDFPRA